MYKSFLFLVSFLTFYSQLLFAQCEPTFNNVQTFSKTNGYEFQFADVDFDNDFDIVSTYQNGLAIYKNDGFGNFTQTQIVNIGYHSSSIDTGDFDGDGDLDVVLTNGSNPDYVWIFKNDGSGLFTNTNHYGIGDYTNGVHVGDIDGDGDVDFMLTAYSVLVFSNDGTGNFTQVFSYGANYAGWSALKDLDNDNDLDIVFGDRNPNVLKFLINDGNGSFVNSWANISLSNESSFLTVEDINQDNYNDIISTDATGNMILHINNGDGTFSSNTIYNAGNFICPYVIDLDYDNDYDIVFNELVGGKINILLNDGIQNFSYNYLNTTNSETFRNIVADLNQDGKLDIVVYGGYYNPNFYVLLNYCVTPSLIAYYPFNGNANDESGNGNNGVVDGATLTADRCGNLNSAYDFDGDNDKIITPVTGILTNSLTLCAWYKVRSYVTDASLISSRSTGDGGYKYSGLDVSNNPIGSAVLVFSKSYGLNTYSTDETFRNSDWHFAAGTYDGTVVILYGDGQLLAETPATGPVDMSGNYIIGFDNSVQQNRYFDGIIDEVRIYNYALSETEVLELFAQCPFGTIEGTVTSSGTGLQNVLVKLLNESGLPVEGFDILFTDSDGYYSFTDVPIGNYQVMIVEPLGYMVDQNPKVTSILSNETSTVNFELNEIVVVNDARSKGYWKHQFDVYVTNKGNAQETKQDLENFINLVHQHYTLHYGIFSDYLTFEDWQGILSLKGNQPMADRAKQHLAALIMNMVSNKVGQYTIVTADGRDVGDVVQYVSDLILDGITTNDELAKDLAESVNNQQMIAAGIVPEGSMMFKISGVEKINTYELFNNYPNPFNPTTQIKYQIPDAGLVTLKLYDVLGNEVIELVNEVKNSGVYSVEFNAENLASGVYIYKLSVNSFVDIKKMVLLR